MLTDTALEQLFARFDVPERGRQLIRQIRMHGPVRELQDRMDTVRTRYMSKKMGRAVFAESRTVEFPAIFLREHDKSTLEYWPQPVHLDLRVPGGNRGVTRVQHTPDLFAIEDDGFVIEEWREESRLRRLALERPHLFWKDEDDSGRWHYGVIEEHLADLGIRYRLRSADEIPRVFVANMKFLEDFTLATAPPVPLSEAKRLLTLLAERRQIEHLELVHEHHFSADTVFKMVLSREVYVDLTNTVLSRTEALTIYCDESTAKADAILRSAPETSLPKSVMPVCVGRRFLYDGRRYVISLVGSTSVVATDDQGRETTITLKLLQELFEKEVVASPDGDRVSPTIDFHEVIIGKTGLAEALERLDALAAPDHSRFSDRSIRRIKARIQGLSSPQERLAALIVERPGNRTPRLPTEAVDIAFEAARGHNSPACPTVLATYHRYQTMCQERNVVPMGKSSFYEFLKSQTEVAAREGRRKAKAKAPIPLTFHYNDPVHGVLPHEVVYCDHTIVNLMLKGMHMPNLGKPVLTLMVDGAMAKARAFHLSYRPAGTEAVLMCLRDYVRRHGRLPRILVVDNGKEFHGAELREFCSIFGITLRWRRRSTPRDSSMVERMLGATEQEVISALEGNSIALKDPRSVSSSHHPERHIAWTLPALHGALEHYLFSLAPARPHPRLLMTPNEFERRANLEMGAREHLMVRYDQTFKLLTAPHSGPRTRVIDRQRGVFLDGIHYWNPRLALAKDGEEVEVRAEPWNASIVYVCW